MEKRDILLNMRGEYHGGYVCPPTLELYAEGTLSKKDGAYIIEYNDDRISGGLNLRLVLKEEEIRMQCTGKFDADFLFAKDQCFLTAYPTEGGVTEVLIFPHDISSRLSSESGTIDLDYTIKMGDRSAHNRLKIDYRLREPSDDFQTASARSIKICAAAAESSFLC